MRALQAIFVSLLLALVSFSATAQETLRIGYFDIPPHVTGVKDGRPRGAAISYFEEHIAPRLGLPFEWATEVTAPTRLMSQLKEGEIDAMIFLGKTDERTQIFHYPNPYLIIPEAIALKVENPLERISSIDELYGQRLGFLVGGRIPEPLQSDQITYDLIAGKRLMERNVEKLLMGRIDGIYAPLSTAVSNILEDTGAFDEVKLVPIEFLAPVEIYTVFSKQTVQLDTIDRYNTALAAASAEVEYKEYLKGYLSTAPD
ncbi:substrate-binding periplasmic protein [Parasedimentitalea denitrificans]|nr:transporter substrate-binding domain-containing protein [Sedimentitalea sp. CY04]